MPAQSSKYKIGYRAECRARNELRDRGYLVVRSAGSKTPFDLIAINKNEVIGVQVKVSPYRKTINPVKFLNEMRALAVPEDFKMELWVWETRRGWHYYQCTTGMRIKN